MDTTITYVFPENYNRISILKGSQDVRYGVLLIVIF
ncbi:Plug domain-containing protein [Helicobacter cinaedi]|nr:Plug domain-containing protein [Helicobacter cinaedi]